MIRNFDREGWITQLQGRQVVGHYGVMGTNTTNGPASLSSGGTFRTFSLRNPAVSQAQRQRWAHVLKGYISITATAVDDAAFSANAELYTIDGFTVSDSAGNATTVRALDGGALTSEMVVRYATSLSGGTLTTFEHCLTEAMFAQGAATGTDTFKRSTGLWQADFGPCVLKGDQGLATRVGTGLSAPGTLTVYTYVEWIETVPK